MAFTEIADCTYWNDLFYFSTVSRVSDIMFYTVDVLVILLGMTKVEKRFL